MKKKECFKVRLCSIEMKSIFDIGNSQEIFRIDCDRSLFCVQPTVINADPFLYVHNDKLYLFYESKILSEPGVIKMTWTSDLKHWSKPVIVLNEPFHLSFPYVFSEGGQIYMVPETGDNHSIRLYKADNDDLSHFTFITKLIDRSDWQDYPRIDYCDSSIIKKGDKYYLFTSVCEKDTYELRLFFSDSFDSGYLEHPLSPIVKSNKYGRCGGCVFAHDGELFRIAQDCENGYGNNIHILRITELTPDEYKEEISKENIIPTTGFYKNGGHQLNIAEYKGQTIVATDAKEYHYFILSRLLRRMKIIGS